MNFLVLAGGLGYLIKKHGGPYFAQRSEQIRKGMDDAERARAEADAKVAEVDRRLANLKSEIEALKRNAQQEADAEAQRVRREADAEMAKIQTHLADEIASASKAARLDLRRYSAGLALSLAETEDRRPHDAAGPGPAGWNLRGHHGACIRRSTSRAIRI